MTTTMPAPAPGGAPPIHRQPTRLGQWSLLLWLGAAGLILAGLMIWGWQKFIERDSLLVNQPLASVPNPATSDIHFSAFAPQNVLRTETGNDAQLLHIFFRAANNLVSSEPMELVVASSVPEIVFWNEDGTKTSNHVLITPTAAYTDSVDLRVGYLSSADVSPAETRITIEAVRRGQTVPVLTGSLAIESQFDARRRQIFDWAGPLLATAALVGLGVLVSNHVRKTFKEWWLRRRNQKDLAEKIEQEKAKASNLESSLDDLKKEYAPAKRKEILIRLVNQQDERVIEILTEELRGNPDPIRTDKNIVEQVGKRLIQGLASSDANIKLSAAEGLGLLKYQPAVKALQQVRQLADKQTQYTVDWALAEISPTVSAATLRQDSTRARWLQTIGFKNGNSPFSTHDANNEQREARESFRVDPPTLPPGVAIVACLTADQNAFLFAGRGEGKTFWRRWAAESSRERADVLVIEYANWGRIIQAQSKLQPTTYVDEFLRVAVDELWRVIGDNRSLFLYLRYMAPSQQMLLRWYQDRFWADVSTQGYEQQRFLEKLAKGASSAEMFVSQSDYTFVKNFFRLNGGSHYGTDPTPEELLSQFNSLLESFGITQVHLFLDNVPVVTGAPGFPIQPLLPALERFQRHCWHLKFVLDVEFESFIANYHLQGDSSVRFKIKWDDPSLDEFLQRRLQSGLGVKVSGLGAISGEQDSGSRIDQELIRAAHGSPKRLLRLVEQALSHRASIWVTAGESENERSIRLSDVESAIHQLELSIEPASNLKDF